MSRMSFGGWAISLTFAESFHQSAIAASHGTIQSFPAEVAEHPALYRLPDGTLPYICITVGGENGSSSEHCEFCRIADQVLLSGFEAPILLSVAAQSHARVQVNNLADHRRSTSRARAPPVQI